MGLNLEKMAEMVRVAGRTMNEDERLIFASAVETVLHEKEAGNVRSDISEEDAVLLGAAVADELLREDK